MNGEHDDINYSDQYKDVPTYSEAVEAELIEFKQHREPPDISIELANKIRDELNEDPELHDTDWIDVAYDSLGDEILADLIIRKKRLEFRTNKRHPAAKTQDDAEIQLKLDELNDQIEARRQELLDPDGTS